jgi:hypothetical protein
MYSIVRHNTTQHRKYGRKEQRLVLQQKHISVVAGKAASVDNTKLTLSIVVGYGFCCCSEGKGLTKDIDEKCYWGNISYEDEKEHASQKNEGGGPMEKVDNELDDGVAGRLFVKGSVLFGYGLEPLPVGRFIMREATMEEEYEDDDDDDQNNDEPDDGIEWSNAFQ